MISESTAKYVAEIQVLEAVVIEICKTKRERLIAYIEVEAKTGMDGACRCEIDAIRIAFRVKRIYVCATFTFVGNSRCRCANREVGGLGITAGEAES